MKTPPGGGVFSVGAGCELEGVEDVLEGIHGVVVDAHFVVQVGACGAAGRAYIADDVAALDAGAGADAPWRQQAVALVLPLATQSEIWLQAMPIAAELPVPASGFPPLVQVEP